MRFVINLLHMPISDALGIASLSLWIWMLRVDCQLEAFEFNCWLHIKSEVCLFLDFSESLVRFARRLENPVIWSTHLQQRNSLWVSLPRWLHVHKVWLRLHSALLALATKFHRETVDTFVFLCTFVACGSPTIIRMHSKWNCRWADDPDLFEYIPGSSSRCINIHSAITTVDPLAYRPLNIPAEFYRRMRHLDLFWRICFFHECFRQ